MISYGDDVVSGRSDETAHMVDIDAEGSSSEGIVFLPQGIEDTMFVHHLVLLPAEHHQQLALAGRHVQPVEGLMHGIEGAAVEVKDALLALLEGPYTS